MGEHSLRTAERCDDDDNDMMMVVVVVVVVDVLQNQYSKM